MSNLAERQKKNPVARKTEEMRWEAFEGKEARLRDQKHLEMAYEWLRNRGKMVLLRGAIENP